MSATQTVTTSLPMPRHTQRTRQEPARREAERVVLTGFMGSGKSTVGRLLAEELGWEFVDLDDVIEQRSGMGVAQIFAQRGEEVFRKEETAALVATLRRSRAVIALGGGAPETLANRLFLEQTPATAIIFLSASFAALAQRCAEQAVDPSLPVRPLLADAAAARLRYAARLPLYERLAHVSVETEGQVPEETMAAVLKAIAAAGLSA